MNIYKDSAIIKKALKVKKGIEEGLIYDKCEKLERLTFKLYDLIEIYNDIEHTNNMIEKSSNDKDIDFNYWSDEYLEQLENYWKTLTQVRNIIRNIIKLDKEIKENTENN